MFPCVSSPPCCTRRQEPRNKGRKRRKRSSSSKIKQQNFWEWEHRKEHSRCSHLPTKNTHACHVCGSALHLYSYYFTSPGSEGGFVQFGGCLGASLLFWLPCRFTAAQETTVWQEKKLHFRGSREERKDEQVTGEEERRWQPNTTVSFSVFLYHLWRCVNTLRAGEGGERERRGWEGEEEEVPPHINPLRWESELRKKLMGKRLEMYQSDINICIGPDFEKKFWSSICEFNHFCFEQHFALLFILSYI